MSRTRIAAEVVFWAVLVAGVERLGREISGDSFDLLVAACMTLVVVVTHRYLQLPRRIGALLAAISGQLARAFDLSFGLDFHPDDEPHFPQFRRWRRLIIGFAAVDLALLIIIGFVGSPVLYILERSYTLYLIVACLVWIGTWQCLWVLALSLGRELRLPADSERRRTVLPWMGLTIAVALAVLVIVDATVGASGWIAGFAVSLLVIVPSRIGPPLDFRLQVRVVTRSRAHEIRTIDAEEVVRTQRALVVLGAIAVALLTQGHRLPVAAGQVELVTGRLPLLDGAGRAAVWAIVSMSLLWSAAYVFEMLVRRRRSDPAFAGPVLRDRELLANLVRDNLELARREPRPHGDGYLFAAHWWPAEKMVRDQWPAHDSAAGGAGPSYDRHFGRAGRRALRELLKPLDIDLVFIEDGVAADHLPPVIARLYRHLDEVGTRLEPQHLGVLPAVELGIEEIAPRSETARHLTGPLDSGSDATADYDAAPVPGRARILLVLRQRDGGVDDEVSDPFAFTREPGWVETLLAPYTGAPVGTS